LAAATINQRLAAVRRLAYEAADSGLLSPELAAGIRHVKGVKHLGQRSGNWLNIDQARLLVDKSDGDGLRNKRDFAMISILLGCGLRRAELAALNIDDIQIRWGIGQSSIWLEKAAMSERSRCRHGLRIQWING
jgi:site-specific recombinase XerC